MTIIKYPDGKSISQAAEKNELLLLLVSFDGKTVVIGEADEVLEHHILLMKTGFKDTDINKFFRIVLDRDGADWTFVCPPDYKNISDKRIRIGQFYKDGFNIVSSVLHDLGFLVGINIPTRYRRHFNLLFEN